MIRALVLTISDGVYAETRIDRSGPAVADSLRAAGYGITGIEVLPDERDRIAARLREIAQRSLADVVFTTGGTGLAPRDVTPEAVQDVIDRLIPGFGETMRASGRSFTPLASLSRSLAGAAERTLIVALPGSPKGAVESLNAILELVPHVHDLLNGRTAHEPAGGARRREA
ncbi:MAG TPA: MogA/MoaB family molybdenum cofactor biosynthesis protein [Bryobacteraceae bacterium]